MKIRKIVLLSICAILAVVIIIQTVSSNKSTVKTISLKETPDTIEIQTPNGLVKLKLDGSTWYVGEEGFKAEGAFIDNIVNSLKDIRVLEKVGRLRSNEYNSKYELDEDNAITVTGRIGDKTLRTMKVGKDSGNTSQSYVTVDKDPSIYLVQGNYKTVYNKTEDSLKSMTVYNIVESEISEVELSMGEEKFKIEKSAPSVKDASPVWKEVKEESSIEGSDKEDSTEDAKDSVDSKEDKSEESDTLNKNKVDTYLSSIALCNADTWESKDFVLPSNNVLSIKIKTPKDEVTLSIFSEVVDDKTKYYATSNKNSHIFTLTEDNVNKYKKSIAELKD